MKDIKFITGKLLALSMRAQKRGAIVKEHKEVKNEALSF